MKKALIANGIITDVVDAKDVFEIAEDQNMFWVKCSDKVHTNGGWAYIDGKFVYDAKPKFDTIESRIINRRVQYGSVEEQLAMMYDDMVNGTTTWKDHIAKVKSETPRPGDLIK